MPRVCVVRMVEHPTEATTSAHQRPSLRGDVRVHRTEVRRRVTRRRPMDWRRHHRRAVTGARGTASPARLDTSPRRHRTRHLHQPLASVQRLTRAAFCVATPTQVALGGRKVARRPHPAQRRAPAPRTGWPRDEEVRAARVAGLVDVVNATTWVDRRHKACLRRQTLRLHSSEPAWRGRRASPPGRVFGSDSPGFRRRSITFRRWTFGRFHERRIESFVRPLDPAACAAVRRTCSRN